MGSGAARVGGADPGARGGRTRGTLKRRTGCPGSAPRCAARPIPPPPRRPPPSAPRLPPGDRRHLLPGHLLHGRTVAGAGVPRCARTGTRDRCGRAALCAHGRAMPVTRLRARRLNRADAQSSGEGAARPPLCADEAGESWSGRGHRGCTRRCLSRAGVRTPVLGSLTRPAAGARCWWRFQVQGRIRGACRQTAVDAAIGSLPHRARFAKQDSSVQRNTH